eukprot:TRINITY_DN70882_c0_g1_i1.p1 TRINITY_DN70882_c0_g1~~TRINITY_DN70882_c0_g1_i1.p1  ORF type:complete len:248 (-),score=95.77 TRINITY_DN70882_c0_g1_i1:13-756(-)
MSDDNKQQDNQEQLKVCIIGISGKLGQFMTQHCLDRGYKVVGVCREQSVKKLDRFGDRITVFPGRTNNRDIIKQAVEGCDAVLTVLVPWGVDNYSSGTAQAVMDFARKDARLIFSCGLHITRDGKDEYSCCFVNCLACIGWIAKCCRAVDIDDQVRACDNIFKSDTKWTVVRGPDLETGDSEGLPLWSRHVQDPVVKSNIVRRIDFALFMVHAITDDSLIQEAPVIVSCNAPSALEHGPSKNSNASS